MKRGRRPSREAVPGIVPVYEGPQILTELLRRAGSPHDADAVAETFARAQRAGEPRSSVIPGLFPEEPRFETPDDARRLYSNLFGLWARVAAGQGPNDEAPEVVAEPAPPPPLPERGLAMGTAIASELVDVVWRHLATSPPRELQRRRDRFANVQPELLTWLDSVPLPESGAIAAMDLAFELWAMFDQAFGDRLRAVDFRVLRALEREPPPMEDTQPAVAAYAAEQLDLLADEDVKLGEEDRAQVEQVVAVVAAALTASLRPMAEA